MANSTNNISAEINMNGQRLNEVTSFKYLEATLCKDNNNNDNNNSNNNEILIKREPLVYTRAPRAVQKGREREKKKRLGQYNSNNN